MSVAVWRRKSSILTAGKGISRGKKATVSLFTSDLEVTFYTTIMMKGRTNVKSFLTMRVPRETMTGLVMDKDLGTRRS